MAYKLYISFVYISFATANALKILRIGGFQFKSDGSTFDSVYLTSFQVKYMKVFKKMDASNQGIYKLYKTE